MLDKYKSYTKYTKLIFLLLEDRLQLLLDKSSISVGHTSRWFVRAYELICTAKVLRGIGQTGWSFRKSIEQGWNFQVRTEIDVFAALFFSITIISLLPNGKILPTELDNPAVRLKIKIRVILQQAVHQGKELEQ